MLAVFPRALAGCLAVVGWANLMASAADQQPANLSRLSRQVDAMFQQWDSTASPGFMVGVFRDGRLLHQRGYGMANIDYQVPLSEESVFHVMSLSKSFVTVCVAQAMDQGLFAPEDNVRTYIPELNDFGSSITIRHLLTCRSGLRDYWDGMVLLGREPMDSYAAEDVFDFILRQKKLRFAPGERWSYSTSDWFLLGMVVERTSGKSMRQYADEQLFAPLDMRHTFFDDRPEGPLAHRADGHGHDHESFVHLRSTQ